MGLSLLEKERNVRATPTGILTHLVLPSNRGNTVLVENLSWVTFPCQERVGERFRFVPSPLQIWGSSWWCLWRLGPSLFPLVLGENFLL